MTVHRIRRFAALVASVAVAVPLVATATPASAAVDSDTAAMLQAMVAEEKLAHDVYVTLGALYPARQFDSIARSEERHQDALRSLLARYHVVDPTAGDPVGVFDDPAVQQLYDSLVAEGSVSAQAAAAAGITVEKLDIADLQRAIAENPPSDVTAVLTSLLAGSQKHLAAFTRLEDGVGTAAAVGRGQQQGRWSR